MIELNEFKANLQNIVGQEQIVTYPQDGDEVMVAIMPPGISIDDLAAFLHSLLGDTGDAWNILPSSLPIKDLRLESLFFNKGTDDHPFQLEFTINWDSAHWELIPGVLALANPSITLQIIGSHQLIPIHANGTVSGLIEIEEIPIFIEVMLPDGTFKAELVQSEETQPTAGLILNKFQAGAKQQESHGDQGFDLGPVTLEDLSLLGSVRTRRLLVHLALGQIDLGPGELETQLTVDYMGGANSQLSGMIWGQYNISRKGSNDDTLFSLMLLAAYDGPGKSWKFEGGAVSGSEKAVSIKDLIEAFTDADGIPGIFAQLGIKYLHLAYETGPGNFEFQCDVEVDDLFGAGVDVELIVDVRLQRMGNARQANPPNMRRLLTAVCFSIYKTIRF